MVNMVLINTTLMCIVLIKTTLHLEWYNTTVIWQLTLC